jgi:hypothetical protein
MLFLRASLTSYNSFSALCWLEVMLPLNLGYLLLFQAQEPMQNQTRNQINVNIPKCSEHLRQGQPYNNMVVYMASFDSSVLLRPVEAMCIVTWLIT